MCGAVASPWCIGTAAVPPEHPDQEAFDAALRRVAEQSALAIAFWAVAAHPPSGTAELRALSLWHCPIEHRLPRRPS